MGEFEHGLFGCFDNFKLCIISYFVPCYTFGKNAEAVGENCALYGCLSLLIFPCVEMKIRGLIREKYEIEGSAGMDFAMGCFCGFCALVQDAQQVADEEEEQEMERQ